MKKYLVLITLHLFFLFHSLAQNQNNVWYFGDRAGLDFNTLPPTPIQSNFFAFEGTASICDPSGQLLFYTNGLTVWDRNKNVMPNGGGLVGGASSTQSALIVPFPNSCSQYYLFTTEDHGTDGGMAYSIVDMCLNNGLGDIKNSSKNTVVINKTTEKITAVLHSNGVDIWIITHTLNSNQFLAYLLTSAGLTNTPVVSNIGSFYDSNAYIGPVHTSHDGSKIISVASFYHICDMFDFNNTSGKLSTYVDLNQFFPGSEWFYGIEFSPDDSLLYLSTFYVTNHLYQFNLKTHQLTELNSMAGNYGYGALQMGPDKKIYMARYTKDFLDVIHKPNLTGLACQYDEGGQVLLPGTISQHGMPNFVPYSFFENTHTNLSLGNDTTLCEGDSLVLNLVFASDCPTDFIWNDGSSAPQKIITQSGIYSVQVTRSCLVIKDTIVVSVLPFPSVAFTDSSLCPGDTITLDASENSGPYTWSDGSTQSFLDVSKDGTYWVTLTNSCKTDTQFVNITTVTLPVVDLRDSVLCDGEKITLGAASPGAEYLWSDGSSKPTLEIKSQGTFWVQVYNSCFSVSDTAKVELIPKPDPALGDSIICEGQKLTLNAAYPGANYLWSDGSTGSAIVVEKEGMYWVELSNICFTSKTFANISSTTIPSIDLSDTLLCKDVPFVLNATFPGSTYLWSDHSVDPILHADHTGNFWVIVTNKCGRDSTSISVELMDCDFEIYMPNVFTPNGDGINDFVKPVANSIPLNYVFFIFDRWGDCVFKSTTYEESWDGLFRNKKASEGVYAYTIDFESIHGIKKHLTGDLTLIR
ncbi:MAG: gliding motility-associated C-terminal domain-containing protein [Saprospiraceae bacterium]